MSEYKPPHKYYSAISVKKMIDMWQWDFEKRGHHPENKKMLE